MKCGITNIYAFGTRFEWIDFRHPRTAEGFDQVVFLLIYRSGLVPERKDQPSMVFLLISVVLSSPSVFHLRTMTSVS